VSRARATLGLLVLAAVAVGLGAYAAERGSSPPAVWDPAHPDVPLVAFGGRGFGHGVGMPQYGAHGAALAGWDAARIIAYYYPGTTLATQPSRTVRVLVAERRPSLAVSRNGPWRAVDPTGGAPAVALTPGAGYRLTPAGSGVAVADATGAPVATFPGAVDLEPTGAPGAVAVDRRVYRGSLRVVPRGGTLDAVNEVDLEDYLAGVVPREMPASWGDDAPAALQAQAIAARTYALAGVAPGREFDLYDDQRSQVYGGRAAEDQRTTAAVRATAGRVVTYGGRPITAFFFSSSGGRTEDGQNVFPGVANAPYLRSVADPFDDSSPYHRWSDPPVVDGARLARLLGLSGTVVRVDVVRRGASPRVLTARVTTAWPLYRRVDVSGAALEAKLGLLDTWFTPVPRTLTPRGGAVAPVPDAARSDVWLAVLNASAVNGAAGRAADRAEERGYVAVATGNAPRATGPSIAYWRPGAEAAAKRAAADLGLAGAAPLPAGGLAAQAPPGAQVIVVLRA
jgi:stage II sporulation protein D